MARLSWCVALALLMAASVSDSAPLRGPRTMSQVRIGAKSKMEFEEKFEGNRRACVIAVGDHKPPVVVGIAVYDDADKLVTEVSALDYVAAIWYPPRDAKYKVVVTNAGVQYNDMYLIFK